MEGNELSNIWKSYDKKLDEVLSLNRELAFDLTKDKLNKTVGTMRAPKIVTLFLGILYTLLLYIVTFIAFKANGLFVMLGFGIIALIMTSIIIIYFYHLHLINRINDSDEIIYVQEKLSKLKISSFNCARLSIIQLPFWTFCWMSLNALKNAPLLYGGVNLIVFLGLGYLAYWIYKRLSIENKDSKISRLLLSGNGWEPITKASKILEQLKEYKN